MYHFVCVSLLSFSRYVKIRGCNNILAKLLDLNLSKPKPLPALNLFWAPVLDIKQIALNEYSMEPSKRFFKNKTTPLHHITAAWVQPKHWWNHPSLAFDPCSPSPAKRPNPAAEPAMRRQSKKMFFWENASIFTNTKNQKTNPQII